MPDVVMPRLSDSMEQGTILSWLKASGDRVEVGDELLEIETDKSTMTHTAEHPGVLEILVEQGATVAVGDVIARVVESEAELGVSSTEPTPSSGTAIGPASASASSAQRAPSVGTDAPPPNHGPRDGRRATPVARRIAAAHGVTLADIPATGRLGRITRADVLETLGLTRDERAAAPSAVERTDSAPARGVPSDPSPLPSTRQPAVSRRPSRVQQLIASRMSLSKTTIPHFQVQTEATMDRGVALRAELKALATDPASVPSLNDLIIKASAVALREHPLANGSYQDGDFLLHDAVNVGMAVATDDALVVPVIAGADAKTIGEIARETKVLAARVRTGEIAPSELDGGTFTVSNLGMFGMTAITPVINPPQAAILGVGALRETLVLDGGEIGTRTLITLTLSCDHRILYGADAARFLARIRDLLERPLQLAL